MEGSRSVKASSRSALSACAPHAICVLGLAALRGSHELCLPPRLVSGGRCGAENG